VRATVLHTVQVEFDPLPDHSLESFTFSKGIFQRKKNMKIGDAVVYVDQHGNENDALLTQVWGEVSFYLSREITKTNETDIDNVLTANYPAVNLIYINSDEKCKDQYGRQIVRETSVVHRQQQHAPGRYYFVRRNNV
jgi:hypothetical protein